MKLSKAIELLTTMKHVCRGLFPPDEQAALSLGIEGLKRLKDIRHFGEFGAVHPLPGETKEEVNDATKKAIRDA